MTEPTKEQIEAGTAKILEWFPEKRGTGYWPKEMIKEIYNAMEAAKSKPLRKPCRKPKMAL